MEGETVITPVFAVEPKGKRLTYKLSGPDEDLMELNYRRSATPTLILNKPAKFEEQESYEVSVEAMTKEGSSEKIDLKINVLSGKIFF